jgi:hypothetical protein
MLNKAQSVEVVIRTFMPEILEIQQTLKGV